MSPETVIEAYVNDIAKRLPRAKRNDVALELHTLLREDLQNKSDALARPADEAMALELVRAFGAPDEVADRYRAPGFVIIPRARTNLFAAMALGGVALQWLITLPPVFAHIFEPGREFVALGHWWTTAGLGAFWWPGFLVVVSIIAAWMRHTWPAPAAPWNPRAQDSGEINRTAWAFGAVAASCGVVILIAALASPQTFFPPAAAAAFALAPDFIPIGGALVAVLWIADAVHFAMVFTEGRWRPLTRRIHLALTGAWLAVLLWFIFGPTIFLAPAADQTAKGALALVVAVMILTLGVELYRLGRRPRPPALSAFARR